jgi:hypothetical protein
LRALFSVEPPAALRINRDFDLDDLLTDPALNLT